MMWKDEIAVIEELSKRVMNIGSAISREIVQLESRRDTLKNEIAQAEADFQVLKERNEETKKEFSKTRRLDIEQLEEGRRRVTQKELVLLEKEKALAQLKAELEAEIANAKRMGQMKESIGRINNNGRK